MNDVKTATLLFESLVDVIIERKELGEVEALLRRQLQTFIETLPLTAEYEGYIAYLAKNSPSRRMDYDKLKKVNLEQYEWLVKNNIIKIFPPKTMRRLVIGPVERKKHE